MNPYYATGFLSALVFWVWPAFLYRNLDAHWLTVAAFAALIFIGAGRAVSEFHIRYIAPRGLLKFDEFSHSLRVCGMCGVNEKTE